MSHRQVITVTIDAAGYVMAVHNDNEQWSPRCTADVILDIELGSHDYYVAWPERHTDIRDASDHGGRYLRTDRHEDEHNDLVDLPRWAADTSRVKQSP
jgi:hypothetical protein